MNVLENSEYQVMIRIDSKTICVTFFSSSLLWPKSASLSSAACVVRPSLLHLRLSKTFSVGTFSWKQNTISRRTSLRKFQEKKKRKFTRSTASFKTASRTSLLFSIVASHFQKQKKTSKVSRVRHE